MKTQLQKSIKFSVSIAVITFVLAAIFSVISTMLLNDVYYLVGIIIVFTIVFIGVIFDMLGIAATAANEVPFHAMAAEKVNGAKQSITIVRNADRFASFCNDVIGDIAGVISGTASTLVVLRITSMLGQTDESTLYFVISVVFTSLVAAITVGGKALGKYFAVHHSTEIIFFAARVISLIERKLKVNIVSRNNKKKKSSKKLQ
ncbi:membrane protein [Pontibacillus litoralis]|uniref:membrane protein n=1 Tax=Pontibacillus litoralis TaxID=516703 RepID=UPI00056D7D3E|nr:membrane protein [Pontibacillus litoralis]